MDDRFNTAAGWVLFAGIIALGLSSISSKFFHTERPETLGYPVEVAEVAGPGGGMTVPDAVNEMTPSDGEKVFAKCTACHTINAGGANGIGPNLHDIMGKPIGTSVSGFAYSSALAEKGGVWDFYTMDEWLKSPRGFANGTKMSFAGLSDIKDRAAVALYMNANGAGIPIPEAVEVVAEGAEAEAEEGAAAEAEAEQDAAAEIEEGGA